MSDRLTTLVWAMALGTLLAGANSADGSTSTLRDHGEPPAAPPSAFASERATFAVRFRDIVNPYRVFLMTAVPGERVRLEVVDGSSLRGRYSLEADVGTVERLSDGLWAWNAPAEEGTYRVVIRREATSGSGNAGAGRQATSGSGNAGAGRPAAGDAITLNAVVMVPMETLESGTVHGYRVGDFPQEPYRDLPQYLPPRGFIPLTPAGDLQVSPHFTLAQFPCKGPEGYPKYVVLSEKLLLKLELLLERANAAGVETPTFQVLSAFRSPWYNASIGRPRYSRHIYGDAADIYVDNDADGRMDDLNADGRIDLADATVLHRLVEEMDGAASTAHLIGGLGQYPTTPNHGPFIHVDTREYRARW
jgi:hypothetical protein